MYLPTKHPVGAWKQQIALAWVNRRLPKFDGPVWLDLLFLMPRPKSRTRKRGPNERYKHITKPDASNLQKAVEDALNGIAWHDDCQVYKVSAEKWVCGDGDEVGALISIREVNDE